jgi:hypothetical protein
MRTIVKDQSSLDLLKKKWSYKPFTLTHINSKKKYLHSLFLDYASEDPKLKDIYLSRIESKNTFDNLIVKSIDISGIWTLLMYIDKITMKPHKRFRKQLDTKNTLLSIEDLISDVDRIMNHKTYAVRLESMNDILNGNTQMYNHTRKFDLYPISISNPMVEPTITSVSAKPIDSPKPIDSRNIDLKALTDYNPSTV